MKKQMKNKKNSKLLVAREPPKKTRTLADFPSTLVQNSTKSGHSLEIGFVAASAANTLIYVASKQSADIVARNAITGKIVGEFKGHSYLTSITSVIVSNDGHLLLSGNASGQVCVWSAKTYELMDSAYVSSLLDPRQHDSIECLALSKHNQHIFASTTNKLFSWQLNSEHKFISKQPHFFHFPIKIKCLALDFENNLAAVGDTMSLRHFTIAPIIQIDEIDLAQRRHWETNFFGRKYDSHSKPITSMAVTRSELRSKAKNALSNLPMLLTGSEDSLAKIWNLDNGECLHTLDDHLGEIGTVRFSEGNTFALTSGHDGRFVVWYTCSGGKVLSLSTSFPFFEMVGEQKFVAFYGSLNSTNSVFVQRKRCLKNVQAHKTSFTVVNLKKMAFEKRWQWILMRKLLVSGRAHAKRVSEDQRLISLVVNVADGFTFKNIIEFLL